MRVSVMYIHHAGPMATRVLHVVDHEQKPGRHGKHLTVGGNQVERRGMALGIVSWAFLLKNTIGIHWVWPGYKLINSSDGPSEEHRNHETQDLRMNFDVQQTLDQVSHIINQLLETSGLNIIFHIFKHGISGGCFQKMMGEWVRQQEIQPSPSPWLDWDGYDGDPAIWDGWLVVQCAHLEKWWSSSMVGGWHPIYYGK